MRVYAEKQNTDSIRHAQDAVSCPVDGFSNSSLLELLSMGERPTRGTMPSGLRQRMEALTGVSLAGIEVREDSVEADILSTPAFTNGNTIYLAHGQERELPHELSHMAQLRTGNVPNISRERGVNISYDSLTESHADSLAREANQITAAQTEFPVQTAAPVKQGAEVIQMSPRGRIKRGVTLALAFGAALGLIGAATAGLGVIPFSMMTAGGFGALGGAMLGGGIGMAQYKPKLYSNKQPRHYNTEKKAFEEYRKMNPKDAYRSSFQEDKEDFQKNVARGERFLWTLDEDEFLTVASPVQNQHPVVAGNSKKDPNKAKRVISAGSGQLRISARQDLEGARRVWQQMLEASKTEDEKITYQKLLDENPLDELPNTEQADDESSKIIDLDLQSGHYKPGDDSIADAIKAWKAAGYEVSFEKWLRKKE